MGFPYYWPWYKSRNLTPPMFPLLNTRSSLDLEPRPQPIWAPEVAQIPRCGTAPGLAWSTPDLLLPLSHRSSRIPESNAPGFRTDPNLRKSVSMRPKSYTRTLLFQFPAENLSTDLPVLRPYAIARRRKCARKLHHAGNIQELPCSNRKPVHPAHSFRNKLHRQGKQTNVCSGTAQPASPY